jgi:hypothetical protein
MKYVLRYYAQITRNDGTTVLTVLPKNIVAVDFATAVEFQADSEILLGAAAPPVTKVTFTKVSQAKNPELYEFLSRDSAWRMNTAKIFCSRDGGVTFTSSFEGLMLVREEELNTVSFVVRGYLDLLNITLVETPLLRNRKTATFIPPVSSGMTDAQINTLLNAQNPTLASGRFVGVINAILWLIGGRPVKYRKLYDEQYTTVAGQYPKFFYDCESSIINPEWIWFNYENLYSDIAQLCRASGGLLRQGIDGVVKYTNSYNFRSGVTNLTLTDSDFTQLQLKETGTEPYSRIVTSYTPRFLAGSQEVYKMVFDEYLASSQTVTRRVDFNKPVWKLVNKTTSGQLTDTIVSSTLKDVKSYITAVDLFGTRRVVKARVAPHTTLYIPKFVYAGTPGNFSVARDTGITGSQSTSLIIENTGLSDGASVYIGEVSLFGRALEATNSEVYIRELRQTPTISGFREINIPDNPYIQDESSAKRLSYVVQYLLENPRQSITVEGVPYVSNIQLGSTIRVESNFHQINDEFQITAISFDSSLATVQLSLMSVSGLYRADDVYIVGSSYTTGATKVLSF